MQSLVLADMAIIGLFLQNTFTGRQFVCKIQEREYLIYRRVYFEIKGGWIMSEKKTAEYYRCALLSDDPWVRDVSCGYLGKSAGEGADPF